MRKSIAIATTMAVCSGATAAGALASLNVPSPWYGSDTLQIVTEDVLGQPEPPSPVAGDPELTSGQASNYLAGGSGAGQSAMAQSAGFLAASESIAPMSKMLNGSTACGTYGGTNGSLATNANGISIGMDAVDVYSSVAAGGVAACNGTADGQDAGLLFSANGLQIGTNGSPTTIFTNSSGKVQNWKWALALLYGGLDLSNPQGGSNDNPDCNSVARQNLISHWSNLFQNNCANPNSVCSHANTPVTNPVAFGGALGHAFRRDDASGTSDVFSNLLGMQTYMPSPSNTSNNGFGASPYCNALNWDTNISNNGGSACLLGLHDQFVGPGGIIDPQSANTFTDFKSASIGVAEASPGVGLGNHRKPPTGAWGDAPDTNLNGAAASAYDVLPTSFQDNDPIRWNCLGNTVGNIFKSGEEVCNTDGKLGVVLAIPASDFIPSLSNQDGSGAKLVQYPTNPCGGVYTSGNLPKILNCGPFKTATHGGECPNGDSDFANTCAIPFDNSNPLFNNTQCLQGKSPGAVLQARALGTYDARRHNLALYNGGTAFVQDKMANGKAAGVTVDFFGGMGRIHAIQTVFDVTANGGNPPSVGCQMKDATDQIACLAQADPCSFGYAGDGGKTWSSRLNVGNINGDGGASCTALVTAGLCASNGVGGFTGAACPAACLNAGSSSPTLVADSLRVDSIYPAATTVLALGTQGTEYQISRKLYLNSLVGFSALPYPTANATWTDQTTPGEISFAEYESNTSNIGLILTSVGYFPYSSASNTHTGIYAAPFCEDFNEEMVCVTGALATTTPTNVEACGGNSTIPAPTTTGLSPIPTTGSVCGNGVKEAYEECDNGTLNVTVSGTTLTPPLSGSYLPTTTNSPATATAGNGASGNSCSTLCRCAGTTSYENIGDGSGFHCQ